MSKTSPRSYAHKAWRACAHPDSERLGVPLESLHGKLCYTRCKKNKKECKPDKLETLTTDLNDPAEYAKFRDTRMSCRSEI